MKICAKEARRLKSKIEFRRLMEKMKKRFLDFLAQYEVYGYLKKWVVDLVRRICKVGKGAQVENLLFYWFFCASVDVGRFLYLNKYASGLGSTNLSEKFFGLIFPTKRIFEPTVLLLKKAARCQPFLAVVRCLFHNHLRLKRSSLLNVYLNYKFEISLLTSHLFFSLFILIKNFWRWLQSKCKSRKIRCKACSKSHRTYRECQNGRSSA